LSIAQPPTVTVPETVAPWAGASMRTVGITAAAATVTVTLVEPMSGLALVSAAVTVIV